MVFIEARDKHKNLKVTSLQVMVFCFNYFKISSFDVFNLSTLRDFFASCILTSFVFYQTSWNIISKRLAESVVADINVLVKLIDDDLFFYANNIANKDFHGHKNLNKPTTDSKML